MGLFDRMKEEITVDISEKISYGTSIRKLAGEIKTNESEIRRLINQTGSRCVEKNLHESVCCRTKTGVCPRRYRS